MKTVFDNSMTAHVWARQTQRLRGTVTMGNCFLRGTKSAGYGRHYSTGCALPRRTGNRFASFWSIRTRYCITTARHVTYVQYAIPGALGTPGLTELARLLNSAFRTWDYPEVGGTGSRPHARYDHERTPGTDLPAIKRQLESEWPGVTTARRVLDALGFPGDAIQAARPSRRGEPQRKPKNRRRTAREQAGTAPQSDMSPAQVKTCYQ